MSLRILWTTCLIVIFSQVGSAQYVKPCTSNLTRTGFAWEHTGTVHYFIIKWDNQPVQNIGKPPLINGSYVTPVPTNLTVGNHIVQVRSCVNTTPNVCSVFVGLNFAYHP